MAVTLTNLTDRAKQLADLVGSEFVSAAEWTTWINAGYMELYDLIIASYEDYFTISANSTITSGSTITLPAAFYKLRGVDFQLTSQEYINVPQFNFNDRNRQNNRPISNIYRDAARRYRIISDTLEIVPNDRAAGTYRLWYVPAITPLATGSDTIPASMSKFGWEEYIPLYAAVMAQIKGEADEMPFERQKQAIAQRIVTMSANRNADQSERITDLVGGVMELPGEVFFD